MRRTASLVLLGLAVFFAVLAPLLRSYAYPRLAQVPTGRYQSIVMEAKDATLVDYGTLRPRQVPRVTITQTLKGNAEEARRIKDATGRDVVVWDTLSHAAGPDGAMVSSIPERYVFDPHTQQPVHAGGEHVDGTPVRRDGIEFKWPFGVEKRDYRYFDLMTRTSAPIHYRGTRTFHGLEVYFFEQTVPWTQVPLPRKLPLGISPDTVRQLGLERWYTTRRMFWVDPVTGAPVNGEEVHREELRWTGQPGREPITAFAGHVTMRPDYLDHTVSLVASQRQLVLLLTTYLPWAFAALAAALLAASLLLEAHDRRRGHRHDNRHADHHDPHHNRRAHATPRAHDGRKPERATPGEGTPSRGGPP